MYEFPSKIESRSIEAPLLEPIGLPQNVIDGSGRTTGGDGGGNNATEGTSNAQPGSRASGVNSSLFSSNPTRTSVNGGSYATGPAAASAAASAPAATNAFTAYGSVSASDKNHATAALVKSVNGDAAATVEEGGGLLGQGGRRGWWGTPHGNDSRGEDTRDPCTDCVDLVAEYSAAKS